MEVVSAPLVAITVGVDPVETLSVGDVSAMPRDSAQFVLMSDELLKVDPDELVTLAALDAGAPEAGSWLSRRLIDAFRRRR